MAIEHLARVEGLPVSALDGDRDDVVPFAAMAHARQTLENNRVAVEAHARPYLGHSIDMQGVELATSFLKRHLSL